MARAMAKRLRTQAVPSKQALQLFTIECSEARYVALWGRLRARGQQEAPDGELSEQVSEITAFKGGSGGVDVNDRYEVFNPSVLQPILEPYNVGARASGDIFFRDDSTAMQLVGPFVISFTTTRGVERPRRPRRPRRLRRLLRVFGYLSKSTFVNANTTMVKLPDFTQKDNEEARSCRNAHMLALAERLRRVGDALPTRAAAWLHSPTGGQAYVA